MPSITRKLPKIIGVIHLAPLPGSPGAADLLPEEALQRAGIQAVKEAQILTKSGFDGIILENFGDVPFHKTQVGPETIASLAVIAAAVREATPALLGINVLRNDAASALAIAAVTGADFIRVNVLSGIAATDQGLIEGCAAELMRERVRLNAMHVGVLADVLVKHAVTLSSNDLELAIEEASLRGGADGVIVTGATTGRAPEVDFLLAADAIGKKINIPIFLGSGGTPDLLKQIAGSSVRMIVGSNIRKDGKAGAPLDLKRIQIFLKIWKATRKAVKKASPKNSRKKNGKTRRATS